MKQLKVAIIGCGSVSSVHFAATTANPVATLMAVCDIKKERAKKASEKFGVPYYLDYKEVLAQKPDVIHICTPHHVHAEVAIAAANKGIHVLTEKPMAVNLHDADRMIQAAKDNNVTLGVFFQNRYNLSSLAVKEAVDSGELGKILGGRLFVTWLRDDAYYSKSDWKGTWDMEGGGVLIDQAIHTMDLMQWIMGPIHSLAGSIDNRTHDIIHVEDMAEATVFFQNGAIGSVYACNFYTYDADVLLEVHGANGVARLEKEKAVIKIKGQPDKVVYPEGNREIIGKSYWGVGHKSQIGEFYADILANRPVKIDGVAGRKALEFVRAIYYSGTHNRQLVQFPFAEPEGFTPPSLTRP